MTLAGIRDGTRTAVLLALALAGSSTAPAGELDLERLKGLSLAELADIEVSIASRRPERVADIPAAVHVVTADDIRRSGATAIPEVLRMVPGVQVARIDANKWAVAIRGFNGIFSNKLLVLIDGRTVYSPSFSGVFWDIQDTLMEDIDRIEVIRGPGASVWGANAVNGVINIVTRSAVDTVGGLVSAGAGNEQAYLGLRQGIALGEGTFLRAYAKLHRQDAGVFSDGKEATDDWTQGRMGFRLDRDSEDGNALTLQGEVYRQNAGQRQVAPDLTRYGVVQDEDINRDGVFLVARWRRGGQDGSARALDAFLDYVHMDQPYRDYKQYMFEVDYSHLLARLGRHDLTWGLSLRLSQDDLAEDPILPFDPEDRFDALYGAFLQDQITLAEDRLLLTVGTKIEHNDYTGLEIQPTARILWRVDPDHSLWASVSRAVRTPSRVEHDGALFQSVLPPAPAPAPPLATAVRFEGDGALDSEVLVAYELGYRGHLADNLSVDVAAFYNEYDRLRSTPLAFVSADAIPPPPHLTAHFVATNEGSGHTYGLEVAADWRPTDRWRIKGAFTWLEMEVDSFPGEESRTPDNHYSIRSQYALREDLDFDLWLRHVGEMRAVDLAASDVGDYTTLDARLSWQATRDLNVSLVGRNLLGSSHLEFAPDFLPYIPTEVQREVLVQLRWDF